MTKTWGGSETGSPSESRPVIEARDPTKVYGRSEGGVEALAGVSLSVGAGEWVSLVGPSGSGKSTLMNLLNLLDRPTSGTYSLGVREVSDLGGGEPLGFVFQSYNLLPEETAPPPWRLVWTSGHRGSRPR